MPNVRKIENQRIKPFFTFSSKHFFLTNITSIQIVLYFTVVYNFCRFKWVHLSERVAYERAVRKHRMRVEISQAKKEAADFSLKVDQSERMKRKAAAKDAEVETTEPLKLPFPQKKSEEEYLELKKNKKKGDNGIDVLKSLFS